MTDSLAPDREVLERHPADLGELRGLPGGGDSVTRGRMAPI
jgi:hypothetical protein